MPRTAGMTNEERQARWDRVVFLSRRGWTVPAIVDEVGMSTAHVHRIRARYGLSARVRPSTRYTDDEIARVESMLADGCSLAEVARTLGRNRQSVWRKFRGRGWTREQCAEWLRLTGGHLI